MQIKTKDDRRLRIKYRIRKRMRGTTERPRLSVFRSVSHIYVQVIDDSAGQTVASASSIESSVKGTMDKELSANMGENVTEVCNIVASLLNREGLPRLRMYRTFLPGTDAPADALAQLQAIGRRLDLTVEVLGYGGGRMAISYT